MCSVYLLPLLLPTHPSCFCSLSPLSSSLASHRSLTLSYAWDTLSFFLSSPLQPLSILHIAAIATVTTTAVTATTATATAAAAGSNTATATATTTLSSHICCRRRSRRRSHSWRVLSRKSSGFLAVASASQPNYPITRYSIGRIVLSLVILHLLWSCRDRLLGSICFSLRKFSYEAYTLFWRMILLDRYLDWYDRLVPFGNRLSNLRKISVEARLVNEQREQMVY